MHNPTYTLAGTLVHLDVGTGTGSATAGQILRTIYPPSKCYLTRAFVEIVANIDPGSTVAGALGLYNGSTEIGSLTLSASQDAGMFIDIPVNTTAGYQAFTATTPLYLKIKTRPTGGTIAGSVALHAVFEEDPTQTTLTGYGYYGV